MNLRISQSTAFLGIAIAVSSVSLPLFGQTSRSASSGATSGPQSPFAGVVVEDTAVRVNDQIISKSDYDRQMEELDANARQQNWPPQQLEEQKKNLLRDMVDQQLLLSKGKELGITGETEMVKQLDAIRKQNNLDSMEALEAAAKQQGVSFEDFKQHIRDRIITQQVIGQQVYRKVNVTQADLQRYYDAHKSEFEKPESVRLSEILIPVTPPVPSATGTPTAEDPAQIAAAQTKADDVIAKLKGGAKFDELAKTASSGTTAAQGGDLGEFKRGQLAKVLEDQTFGLKAGEYTQPIQTKQGFVILYVAGHNPGGVPEMKDVLPQLEEAVGAERTEPALRAYLKQLREEAYIDYRPGYVDTAAVANPSKPTYSAYNPPAPKKKRKVERTRFRQRAHGSEPKETAAAAPPPPVNAPSLADAPGAATATSGTAAAGSAAADSAAAANPAAAENPATAQSGATAPSAATEGTSGQVGGSGPAKTEDQVAVSNPQNDAGSSSLNPPAKAAKNTQVASNTAATQKPGKKEKIRFGQAPTKTLPSTTATQTVDAGANGSSVNSSTAAAQNGAPADTQVAANAAGDAPSIGEGAAAANAPAEKKSRFSDRSKLPKEKKTKEPKIDPFAPPPVNSQEVADRQVQSAPLGLAGDTSTTKKVKPTEKTRLQDQLKNKPAPNPDDPNAAPAPADAPATPPK